MRPKTLKKHEEIRKQALVAKAAPDLLDALKLITERVCQRCIRSNNRCLPSNPMCVEVSRAYRAIEKAEGRDEFFVYANRTSKESDMLTVCKGIIEEADKGNPRGLKLEDVALLLKDIKAGRAKVKVRE